MANKLKFLFTISTWLGNVHTWAIFFLRHLPNMSCMVPFWASTDSGFVPIWGPRPKPCRLEEVVYILNESCSHFTQRLFPPNVPQHTQRLFLTALTVHSNIIHTYYTSHLYVHLHLYFTRLVDIFNSSDLPGRLAALGFLCPIHLCCKIFGSTRMKLKGLLQSFKIKKIDHDDLRQI